MSEFKENKDSGDIRFPPNELFLDGIIECQCCGGLYYCDDDRGCRNPSCRPDIDCIDFLRQLKNSKLSGSRRSSNNGGSAEAKVCEKQPSDNGGSAEAKVCEKQPSDNQESAGAEVCEQQPFDNGIHSDPEPSQPPTCELPNGAYWDKCCICGANFVNGVSDAVDANYCSWVCYGNR
jgi:hypothetical protein